MHEGHRRRLVGKLKNSNGLYEHELLEVLLFNACPRKDVNAIAHSLIDECGSLSGVLEADVQTLMQVKGVGVNMAEYLVCLGKCVKRIKGCSAFAVVRSTAEFRQFIQLRACDYKTPCLALYLLDKGGRIRRVCEFKSKVDSREKISKAQLLKCISVYKPYGVFAAYFGCDGLCEPTKDDDMFVVSLSEICAISGVRLYDYCIAHGGSETFSYYVADRLPEAEESEYKTDYGKGASHD